MVEAPKLLELFVEYPFAGMTKRCVAKIVDQRQSLGQILIGVQGSGQCPRDLAHFDRMSKAGAVVIAVIVHKNLCFVHQAAKRVAMNDPVTIPLKIRTRRAGFFRDQSAPTVARMRGITGQTFGVGPQVQIIGPIGFACS